MNDQLVTVFRDFFNNDALDLTDESTFADVPGWDSVAHVNLINTLEREFRTRFSVREIMGMNSVGGIRKVLAAKSRA